MHKQSFKFKFSLFSIENYNSFNADANTAIVNYSTQQVTFKKYLNKFSQITGMICEIVSINLFKNFCHY